MNPRRIEPTQMSQDGLPTVAATAPIENNTRGGTPLATQKAPVQSMPRRSDAASASVPAASPSAVAPPAATPPATPPMPPTAASPTIKPRSLSAAALTVLVPSVGMDFIAGQENECAGRL